MQPLENCQAVGDQNCKMSPDFQEVCCHRLTEYVSDDATA